MNAAVLFQGQGSCYSTTHIKGLLRDVPESRLLFQQAEKILGKSLIQIIEGNGNLDSLQTELAQPVIFTSEYASFVVQQERIAPEFLVGQGIGEIAALAVAGSLDFEVGVRLAAERGRLIQQVGCEGLQGMLAIYDCSSESVEELCREASLKTGSNVYCASFNSATNIVVAGDGKALDYIVATGVFHCKALPVAHAFNTVCMKEAAELFHEYLNQTAFESPKTPVLSNVTARPYQAAFTIPELLYRQMFMPIQWAQSIEYMIERGIDVFLQVGTDRLFQTMQDCDSKGVTWSSVSDISVNALYDYGRLYPAHKAAYTPDIVGEILSRFTGFPWERKPDEKCLSRASELYDIARRHLLRSSIEHEDIVISLQAMKEVLSLKGKDEEFCSAEEKLVVDKYAIIL